MCYVIELSIHLAEFVYSKDGMTYEEMKTKKLITPNECMNSLKYINEKI